MFGAGRSSKDAEEVEEELVLQDAVNAEARIKSLRGFDMITVFVCWRRFRLTESGF